MQDCYRIDYAQWQFENKTLAGMEYGESPWVESQIPDGFKYSVNVNHGHTIIPMCRWNRKQPYVPTAWCSIANNGRKQQSCEPDGMYHLYCKGNVIEFFVTELCDAIVVDNLVNDTMGVDASVYVTLTGSNMLSMLHDPIPEIYRPASFVVGGNGDREYAKQANCRAWLLPEGSTLTSYCREHGWLETARKLAVMLIQNKKDFFIHHEWQRYLYDIGLIPEPWVPF